MAINNSFLIIFSLTDRINLLKNQLVFIKKELSYFDRYSIDKERNIPVSKYLFATVSEQLFLTSVSLLDEYQNELTSHNYPEYKIQIDAFKIDAKPAFKRLNKWKHLKDFRNLFMAHNLRLKNKGTIFDQRDEKLKYNIPHFNHDFYLIQELFMFILDCLKKHLQNEILKIDYNRPIDDYFEYTSKPINLKQEIEEINCWRKKASIFIEANN